MLEKLKFFPYRIRDCLEPEEVKGPSKMRKQKWLLYDNILHFKTPAPNRVLGFGNRASPLNSVKPGRKNIPKSNWENVYSSSIGPTSEWTKELFYSSTWYFLGPWFTGEQARLTANALLLTPEGWSDFSEKNLFHPRVFEAAVSNYLNKRYGYKKSSSSRGPMYRGPLNWQILPIASTIQGLQLDIHQIGNSSKDNPQLFKLIFFPISTQKLVHISFNFNGTELYRDKVRVKPQLALCDAIIESMTLDVGPDTLEEWNKVKQSGVEMSLMDSVGEYPWPLKLDEKRNKNNEVDITPSSTPHSIGY